MVVEYRVDHVKIKIPYTLSFQTGFNYAERWSLADMKLPYFLGFQALPRNYTNKILLSAKSDILELDYYNFDVDVKVIYKLETCK